MNNRTIIELFVLFSRIEKEDRKINIIISWLHTVIFNIEVDPKRIIIIKDKFIQCEMNGIVFSYDIDDGDVACSLNHNDSSFCLSLYGYILYIAKYYMHWKCQSNKHV